MRLRVRSIAYLAKRINGYELVDPEERDLPPFTAGAHISVRAGDAPVRDFSLWNDPAERARYCIAVLREPEGLGSREWHERVRAGDIVDAAAPRNNFPLAAEAERHLLIAGGIGITPIMAMIAELRRRRADFRLHYCTRSAEETAFLDDLAILAAVGRVEFHHDGGDPTKGLDLAAVLRDYRPGTHLYYCGPAGMMAAAESAARHWPPGTVHCEYFAGPKAVPPEIPPP
jgi:ferredoxin-NADP reductase